MTEDNMVTIFGPCFLRNNSQDAAVLLDSVEQHKRFTSLLLQTYGPLHPVVVDSLGTH